MSSTHRAVLSLWQPTIEWRLSSAIPTKAVLTQTTFLFRWRATFGRLELRCELPAAPCFRVGHLFPFRFCKDNHFKLWSKF